jgi:flagellar secretion chaperone FliS
MGKDMERRIVNRTAYGAYRQVQSATVERKEDILFLLLDGALDFVRKARIGIQENCPKTRGENISRVLAIITELECALDRSKGGLLAEELGNLYQDFIGLLTLANVKNDPVPLDRVETLLTALKEGFEEVDKNSREHSAAHPVLETGAEGGFRLAV